MDYCKATFYFVAGLALGPLFFFVASWLHTRWELWKGRRRNRVDPN